MAADPSPENIGFIGTAITYAMTGIGSIAATAYVIKRKLLSDKLSDKIDSKSQQLIDNLNARLVLEEEKTKRLEVTIERVARERNEAVQAIGRFEERIKHMESIIERLNRDNSTLINDIAGLRRDNQRLISQISGLRDDISGIDEP